MSKLTYQNRTITDTFGEVLFQTHDQALSFALEDYNWTEEEITERSGELLSVCFKNGEIKEIALHALYRDSGSEDYIYFIHH